MLTCRGSTLEKKENPALEIVPLDPFFTIPPSASLSPYFSQNGTYIVVS